MTIDTERFRKMPGRIVASILSIAFLATADFVFGSGQADAAPQESRKAKPPNVILIVTDDLGYGDLGFQGSKDIPTPHLDALAKQGVRFTNAYVTAPICGATRAGLFSGRYQQRHSYDFNPARGQGLNLKETTLAEALRAGGYATGAIGKWHLGESPEYRPLARGFDEFFGFFGAAHSYVPGEVDPAARMVFETTRKGAPAIFRANPPGAGAAAKGGDQPKTKDRPVAKKTAQAGGEGFSPIEGGRPGTIIRGDAEAPEEEYLTDAFAREAESFIERHREKPFFLYIAFNASHSPLQPTKKYLDRFPGLTGKRQAFAATTSALDDAVGRVVEKLKSVGQDENTIVYFKNDNGGPIRDIAANNAPLSGAKFSLWEGGIRVPSFVSWKGHLPEGTIRHEPVISIDIYPTILAATGVNRPAGKEFEGENLLPVLQGHSSEKVSNRKLFWRFGKSWAVRDGKWKLTLPENGEPVQLFDLENDIAENTDIAAKHPDVVKRLTADWEAWNAQNIPLKEFGGSRPSEN